MHKGLRDLGEIIDKPPIKSLMAKKTPREFRYLLMEETFQ